MSAHRCAVCDRAGEARALTTLSGKHLGHACPGECEALLWESHFVKAAGGTEYEHALVAWQWRCRRCDVEGKPHPPMPESPSEKTINKWIHQNGLEAVAKEFE